RCGARDHYRSEHSGHTRELDDITGRVRARVRVRSHASRTRENERRWRGIARALRYRALLHVQRARCNTAIRGKRAGAAAARVLDNGQPGPLHVAQGADTRPGVCNRASVLAVVVMAHDRVATWRGTRAERRNRRRAAAPGVAREG